MTKKKLIKYPNLYAKLILPEYGLDLFVTEKGKEYYAYLNDKLLYRGEDYIAPRDSDFEPVDMVVDILMELSNGPDLDNEERLIRIWTPELIEFYRASIGKKLHQLCKDYFNYDDLTDNEKAEVRAKEYFFSHCTPSII